MNWLKESLSPSCYYSIIEPEIYHEWVFQGFVPKGTSVFYGNPKHQKLAANMIVVAFPFLNDTMKNSDGAFVDKNYDKEIQIISGQIKSQEEIFDDYLRKLKDTSLKKDAFKQALSTRGYWIKSSHKKGDLLFLVDDISGEQVTLKSYGSIKDIYKKAKESLGKMVKTLKPPGSRATDLCNVSSTDILISKLKNGHIDGTVLRKVFENSGIKHIGKVKETLINCFSADEDVNKTINHLKKMSSLKWIKSRRI